MLLNITHKTCTKCKETKDVSQFPGQKQNRDGKSSWCLSCHRDKNNKRRLENLEEHRARARKRYWENPEKYQKQAREYASSHRKDAVARVAKWRKDNPEKYKAQLGRMSKEKLRTKARDWARANKDLVNRRNREFKKRNPEAGVIYCRNRRARLKGSEGRISASEWRCLKKFYNYTCLSCWQKEPEIKLEIDHVVPVSKGGANVIQNTQPLCKSCNSSKGAKTIDYRPAFLESMVVNGLYSR